MTIETPQTTSLFTGWLLRIMLLFTAAMGFLGGGIDLERRLSVTLWAVPAEISAASLHEALPTSWSSGERDPRAMFPVRIVADGGGETISELHLRRSVIEALLRGEKRRITHAKDNPRRYLLDGDTPPPWGFPLLAMGIIAFAVFLYSLRLK